MHDGRTTADRYHCPRCDADYRLDQICDVCHRGREGTVMATTVYRSAILGSNTTRHCPPCRPPSKVALEFHAAPGAAAAKYALIYGLPALCLLLLLVALLTGAGN